MRDRAESAWRRWMLAGCVALAGCSKHDATATGGAANTTGPNAASLSSTPGVGKLCSLLSPAEVSALSGIPGLQAPTATTVSPVTLCTFSDGRDSMTFTLRFEKGRTVSDFAEIRQIHDKMGQKTTELPGLGDAAASFSVGNINGITVLHAKTVVMVTASVPMEKLAAVMKAVIERF